MSTGAKSRRASDCAFIEAVVDESGHVTEAHVKRPSRDPEFDRRALAEVKKWKRKPALYQGKAVPVFLSASVCPHLSY
jgi:TonB family protein